MGKNIGVFGYADKYHAASAIAMKKEGIQNDMLSGSRRQHPGPGAASRFLPTARTSLSLAAPHRTRAPRRGYARVLTWRVNVRQAASLERLRYAPNYAAYGGRAGDGLR